jgi:glycine hydroxymethyltransferase
MVEVLDGLAATPEGNPEVEASVKERVIALTTRFPIYVG